MPGEVLRGVVSCHHEPAADGIPNRYKIAIKARLDDLDSVEKAAGWA